MPVKIVRNAMMELGHSWCCGRFNTHGAGPLQVELHSSKPGTRPVRLREPDRRDDSRGFATVGTHRRTGEDSGGVERNLSLAEAGNATPASSGAAPRFS